MLKVMFRRKTTRAAARALSVCLLLSASGCRPALHRAEQKALDVRVGMTTTEVETLLGVPDRTEYRLRDAPSVTWTYQYGAGLDPRPDKIIDTILRVAVALAFVVGLLYLTQGQGLPSVKDPLFPRQDAYLSVEFDPDSMTVRRVAVSH